MVTIVNDLFGVTSSNTMYLTPYHIFILLFVFLIFEFIVGLISTIMNFGGRGLKY